MYFSVHHISLPILGGGYTANLPQVSLYLKSFFFLSQAAACVVPLWLKASLMVTSQFTFLWDGVTSELQCDFKDPFGKTNVLGKSENVNQGRAEEATTLSQSLSHPFVLWPTHLLIKDIQMNFLPGFLAAIIWTSPCSLPLNSDLSVNFWSRAKPFFSVAFFFLMPFAPVPFILPVMAYWLCRLLVAWDRENCPPDSSVPRCKIVTIGNGW